jgi:site-specific DNA recombinase
MLLIFYSKKLTQKNKTQKELASINNTIENKILHKKKAIDKYFDEIISKEDYDNYIRLINKELENLNSNKQKLELELTADDQEIVFAELSTSLHSILELDKLTPDILHRFIEKIEIKQDGTPRIFYRFPGVLLTH